MNKNIKYCFLTFSLSILFTISLFSFSACEKSDIPKTINVYITEQNQVEQISFDHYIAGVVQAEISESAPEEALKAQAILARTFTLNFLKNNKSKYENADISNDITEAQAYQTCTSEKIKEAVQKTKKQTLKCKNQYITPLFFANSGGKTANPSEGLNLNDEDYFYIKSVDSPETIDNSNNYSWTATLTKSQILNTLKELGISVASISSFKIGETGESGRAKTFIIGGKEVNANNFRLKIGSTLLKSTLIDEISVNSSNIIIKGRGYGHGVGLSQEGAIILANQGKDYKSIILHYFQDVKIVKS